MALQEVKSAKDYTKGHQVKCLLYGLTGAGKSTAILSHPGKKFVYVFDPAGVETYAGHDVDYIAFIPKIDIKRGKLGDKSGADTKMLRPDPKTYLYFEEDFEERARSGFFAEYDLIAFESITTLIPMMMWYILHQQGRGNQAPEIQDYYFRFDGMANIVRLAAAQAKTIVFSAHSESGKDESTGRYTTSLALPPALQQALPLMFSEVVHMFADMDQHGKALYSAQMKATKKAPLVRTSLANVNQIEDVTVDWSKPLTGQGFFNLYANREYLAPEVIKERDSVKMG